MSSPALRPCPLCEGPATSDCGCSDENLYCCANETCQFMYVDVPPERWNAFSRHSDAAPLVEALEAIVEMDSRIGAEGDCAPVAMAALKEYKNE